MRLVALSCGVVVVSLLAGCGSTAEVTSSGAGGSTTAGTTGGGGTTAASGSGGGITATSAGSGGSGGQGGATTVTAGGSGGTGGMVEPWPTCEAKPADVPEKTLHAIWLENPAAPEEVWVSGAYVTAVSKDGCSAGTACQIFVQEAPAFADLAAAAQRSLKIFASANTAVHFEGIAVGDRVDVQAHAWRYDVDGQNELLLQVNLQLPGCARKVGSGVPVPVTATLEDLTYQAYEYDLGPVFVKLDGVSGKPHLPAETFGLWTTGQPIEPGGDGIVSLSPFFVAGSAFSGLTAEKIHDFTSLTGVFGVFLFPGDTTKYKEVYARSMDDVKIKKVNP